MTDQNNLARDYSPEISDDDPLAELARIVSGQPAKPAASFKPRSFADMAREKTAQLQEMAARQAEEARRAQDAAQRQASIEEALMRELGFSSEAEPSASEQPAYHAQQAHHEQHVEEEYAPAYEDHSEMVETPPPAPVAELSLEDQLMAELGLHAAPAPVLRQAAPAMPAPEKVAEEIPESSWVDETPEPVEHAYDARAEYLPAAHEAELNGVEDPWLSAGSAEAGDNLLTDHLEAELSATEWDVAPELPELGLAPEHADAAYDETRQSPETLEDFEALLAASAEGDEPMDDRLVKDSSVHYGAHEELPAHGDHAAGEISLEGFADELEAVFKSEEADPYQADLRDLEAAVTGVTDTAEPATGQHFDDELFRDLAAGSAPAATARGARFAEPRQDALYGAQTDFVASIDDGRKEVARQPEPAFDDSDFGAAFEAEVRQLQAPVHARPVAAAAAPAAQSVSPHALEDRFAAAFAEELELGFDADDPAVQAPVSGGWQEGETRNASQSFAARAVSRPAYRELPVVEESAYDATDPAQAYYGEQYDPGYDEDTANDGANVPETRHRPRGFMLAAGALGIAMLVAGGALGIGLLNSSGRSGDPVVVKADAGPVKVKPENPGGTEVHNQDQAVYDRVAGEKNNGGDQEKLVTGSEEPVDVAALAASEAENILPADTVEEPAAVDAGKFEERLTPGAAAVPGAADGNALFAPRRVKTVAVKPDGTLVGQPELTSAPAIAAPEQPAVESAVLAAPEAASSATSETAFAPIPGSGDPAGAVITRGEGLAPAAPEPAPVEIVRPAPEPAPEPVTRSLAAADPAPAARPAPSAPASSAPWAVQLASQRSAEDAQATFQNLKRKFPSILDGRALAVQRADVEGKGTFFRVRIPAQTKAEATSLCEQLKGAGGSCFVTR